MTWSNEINWKAGERQTVFSCKTSTWLKDHSDESEHFLDIQIMLLFQNKFHTQCKGSFHRWRLATAFSLWLNYDRDVNSFHDKLCSIIFCVIYINTIYIQFFYVLDDFIEESAIDYFPFTVNSIIWVEWLPFGSI